MALSKLELPDTFLEWCEKTNSSIDVVNKQLSPEVLKLLTTTSKSTLVDAVNEVNEEKLDKVGGIITDSLQINGELDVKNNIRIGSSNIDGIIKLYDRSKLKYRNLGLDSTNNYLYIEDTNGVKSKLLSNNSTIDLDNESIDLLNKRTTSNIIKNITGKESQIYYSQDEKRLYFFDGETVGGYKIPIDSDIGNTSLIKVTETDTSGYLGDKFESDIGLKVSISGTPDNQKMKLTSNTFVSEMKMYAGLESSIPIGWMKCDGRLLSRTTYSELFNKIGTIYGAGDGRTTFAIPNMSGRVPVGQGDGYGLGQQGGEEKHTLTIPEMAEHKHIAPFSEAYGEDPWGLVSKGHYGSNGGRDHDNWWAYTSPVGGNVPHNNMQPYTTIFYIIFTGVW